MADKVQIDREAVEEIVWHSYDHLRELVIERFPGREAEHMVAIRAFELAGFMIASEKAGHPLYALADDFNEALARAGVRFRLRSID